MSRNAKPPQPGDPNYRAAMEIGAAVIVTLGAFILADIRAIRRRLERERP